VVAGPEPETFAEVAGSTGDDRLVLRYVEVPLPEPHSSGRRAYDFHSLAWEARGDDGWAPRAVITHDEFTRGSPRRWVSDLHSFDSVAGTAVVRVGEEQPPDPAGSVHVEYTWREWDVVRNRQVRLLRVCGAPFDPFVG
jgi:hypothetical protein